MYLRSLWKAIGMEEIFERNIANKVYFRVFHQWGVKILFGWWTVSDNIMDGNRVGTGCYIVQNPFCLCPVWRFQERVVTWLPKAQAYRIAGDERWRFYFIYNPFYIVVYNLDGKFLCRLNQGYFQTWSGLYRRTFSRRTFCICNVHWIKETWTDAKGYTYTRYTA